MLIEENQGFQAFSLKSSMNQQTPIHAFYFHKKLSQSTYD